MTNAQTLWLNASFEVPHLSAIVFIVYALIRLGFLSLTGILCTTPFIGSILYRDNCVF